MSMAGKHIRVWNVPILGAEGEGIVAREEVMVGRWLGTSNRDQVRTTGRFGIESRSGS
jgi:hypothetical protein